MLAPNRPTGCSMSHFFSGGQWAESVTQQGKRTRDFEGCLQESSPIKLGEEITTSETDQPHILNWLALSG